MKSKWSGCYIEKILVTSKMCICEMTSFIPASFSRVPGFIQILPVFPHMFFPSFIFPYRILPLSEGNFHVSYSTFFFSRKWLEISKSILAQLRLCRPKAQHSVFKRWMRTMPRDSSSKKSHIFSKNNQCAEHTHTCGAWPTWISCEGQKFHI